MMQALETWGPIKGLWMGLKRIGRCHPWAEGGVDPVPPREGCGCHENDNHKHS